MKIAVTGANGHVGANLCRSLLAEGHQVRALIHEHSNAFDSLDMEFVRGSLQDKESLRALCKEAEVVFHLAAVISIDGQKDKLLAVNFQGTQNLIETIRQNGVRRLIHFSSIHALSHLPLDKPMDETRPFISESRIWYEITKARAERLVLEACQDGLDAVVINPTAIIGPNDFKPSLVGQVLIRLYNNSLPALVPGGYDWVDVRDVVRGAMAAMDKGRKGERYILSGKWVSVKGLAKVVEDVSGKKTVKLEVPSLLAKAGVPFIKAYAKIARQEPLYTHESLHALAGVNPMISHEKASRELGYQPRELDITVRDTLDWFKQKGYLG